MSISLQEMQRQTILYAMEEMRNRGLEEAAQIALERRDVVTAQLIRHRKRDPKAKMTDWWGPHYWADFAPDGA